MSRYSDIQLSLVQGQRDSYKNLLADLADGLCDTLRPEKKQIIEQEFIEQYNNFSPVDFVPFTSKYPGLLVELWVKGEYEEDSCHVRLRGQEFEIVEKEYPPFNTLLSSKESLLADKTFPLNIDLEETDRRALDFLHTHIKKEITINGDLPGNELILVFRTADDNCFAIDTQTVTLEKGSVRFKGIDPATGFETSADEHVLATGQAVIAAQHISQEI